MIRLTLIDLNYELYGSAFVVDLDKCAGSLISLVIHLLPDRVCVSNKTEDVNVNICSDNRIT